MKPFSLIIPTFNNRTLKNSSLNAVLRVLEGSADVIEDVVVVDNGSTDGGFSLKELGNSMLDIRLEQLANRNRRAAARNYAAKFARAPFLVFLDDDMLIPGRVLFELAEEVHEDAFWSCAQRRYIPLHTDIAAAERAAFAYDLDWLVSHSTLIPGREQRSRYSHNAYLFTFISCFGVVPKRLFERADGFCEDFVGWGHEDCEFISRLLTHAPLINLFNRYVTFHLDHCVSPYFWTEQERNLDTFRKLLAERGQRFDILRFAEAVTSGSDIPAALAKNGEVTHFFCERTISDCSPQVRKSVENVFSEFQSKTTILGCMLIGSAASAEQNRDVDMIVLTEYGDHQLIRRLYAGDDIPIEVEVVPKDYLRTLQRCHLQKPEVWLLELGKWANGMILMDTEASLRCARERLIAPDLHRTAFALTYALGRLQILRDKLSRRGTTIPWYNWQAAKWVKAVDFLLDGAFPRSEVEFFSSSSEHHHFLEQSWDGVIKKVKRLAAPPSALPPLPLYYFENFVGVEILKRENSEWARIPTCESAF